MNCDKCGQPVHRGNDTVEVMLALGAWLSVTADSRHFLPTKYCEGSPSRAQYIQGQRRDRRRKYKYHSQNEAKYREAYAKVVALYGEDPDVV